jgi:crotonobetainyl-CoA:carnitine CoA-transferase CaiB-like acyl-CoA transferase
MADSTGADAILRGLRVVEFGGGIAAAAAGALMAQLGAEVRRIDRVSARPTPSIARGQTQRDRLIALLGRGKPVTDVVDPYTEEAFELARDADIVFAEPSSDSRWGRPGWLDRYREAVRGRNRSSWVTISPFGLEGELREMRGGELTAVASGGMAYYLRSGSGRPMKPAGFSTSITSGHFAALAGLHGLLRRDGGEGPSHLDLSVQDSVVATGVFLECSHLLFDCSREGGSANYAAPVGFIECSDGLVWIVVLESHQWAGCVRALGSPDWATAIETAEQRHENSEMIRGRLNEWAAQLSARECADRLQRQGVPATTVNSSADLLNSLGVDVRQDFFDAVAGGGRVPGIPVSVAPRSERAAQASPPPRARHRVAELGQVMVAPLATAWLGAMGVDVVKVEDPARLDVYRRAGPFVDGKPDPETGAYFAFTNHSKRSHAMDLTGEAGTRRLHDFLLSADAVVTNLSRHRMTQLGVVPDALDAADDPFVLSSGGFGRDTSHSSYRAYGLNIQAAGGVLNLTRDRDGQPRNFGTSWADPLTSVWIAIVTIGQLRRPRNERQHVDISMVEAVAGHFAEYFSEVSSTGKETVTLENRMDHAAPHGIYRCENEDEWLAISIETDDEWSALVSVLGNPEHLAAERFRTSAGRHEFEDELDELLDATVRDHARGALFAAAQAQGVDCSPVWGARDLISLPHLRERNLFQELRHPAWGTRRVLGLPWRIVDVGSIPITAAPLLGQHTSPDPEEWWI